MLSAPLDTNHYAFLNLENAATKICSPLNQPNITACFSVKIKSYKMLSATLTVGKICGQLTIIGVNSDESETLKLNNLVRLQLSA